MHRASIFFMTALIAHYSTKALVNYRARLSSLSLRGQISQKFSVLPEKDTPIEPVDIIALQSEVTRSYHELWVLQFDGGSRGNPGVAGSGSVLYKTQVVTDSNKDDINEKGELTGSEEVWYGHNYIGEKATNNVAEYTGLIEGLKQAVAMNISAILIQGDSQLIIRQIQGVYKVKNEELKKLHAIAKNLLESIPSHSLEYIPRAQNVRADELSNMAMDTRQDLSVVAPSQSDPVLEDTGIDIDTDTDGLVVKSIDGDISVEDVSVIGESIHTEERQEIFQSNVGKVGSIKREEKTKFTFENVEIIMDQNEVGDDFTISVVELEGKKGATEKNRVEKYPCLQKIIKLIIVREKQVNPRSLSVVDGSDPNVVKETKKEKQSPIKGTVQSKKLNLVDGKETAALMSAKLKKSSTEQKVIEEESTTGDGTVETVIPPKESRKKKIHIIT